MSGAEVLPPKTGGPRNPGRPRSPEADEAILEAAVELFTEHGYDGLSMERVAERAGVGKATIYRRYPTKADLVLAATACVIQGVDVHPDTGSLQGDVEAIANNIVRKLTSDLGRLVPQLVAEMSRHADLADAHREFIAAKRALSKQAFRRAIDRGEMAPDFDIELAADLLAGPLFYRLLLSGAPLSKRYIASLVDAVCTAVAP
jgi:AcrR family transcriptional regulator